MGIHPIAGIWDENHEAAKINPERGTSSHIWTQDNSNIHKTSEQCTRGLSQLRCGTSLENPETCACMKSQEQPFVLYKVVERKWVEAHHHLLQKNPEDDDVQKNPEDDDFTEAVQCISR